MKDDAASPSGQGVDRSRPDSRAVPVGVLAVLVVAIGAFAFYQAGYPLSKILSVAGLAYDIMAVLILASGLIWRDPRIPRAGTHGYLERGRWMEEIIERQEATVGVIVAILGFGLQALGVLIG